ncbi:hypothetical protein THAOC_21436 [Thalassiosira oceanica]|uniref:Uncharacterized protein n=1 Tax=Thalassiosira oceanica TaxID=159749 RepID=K0RZE3_THAOC|nr:hypothetical protein THAOC_21436 [Thalassiosira oceanica]|eukprot:EJK58435.1 hypothetical protein THAOC_21436 [Thalassiosira oceanica]
MTTGRINQWEEAATRTQKATLKYLGLRGHCFQGLVWVPPLIVRKASIELGCLFKQWRQISTRGVRLRAN